MSIGDLGVVGGVVPPYDMVGQKLVMLLEI